MKISNNDILAFDKNYRANFINSITGFKSITLLGTKNKNGNFNLAIFSQIFHVGANPPLIGVLFRPESEIGGNHSLKNIKDTSFFTLNHITEEIYKKAHQTSARYPENISEFDAVGLTPFVANDFFAPYVNESPLKIGLRKEEEHFFKINGTTLILASIQQVILAKEIIKKDGFVDLNQAKIITGSGLDAYLKTEKIARLSYAKPDKKLENIHF